MKILYFAALREHIGCAQEDVNVPDHIHTIDDLVGWLRGRNETFAAAFADPALIRAAVDQTLAAPQTPLRGATEIAFFPPMTGG